MAEIGIHDRRRLLIRCAFPGCDEPLLEPTPDGSEDTNVGIECHIVPQKDNPTVARAPSSLSEEEREQFADLIADRDGFPNLVMMCLRHSRIIDDPNQPYPVAAVVEMKQGHEREMEERNRSPEEVTRDAAALVYSELVDEWERRFNIAEWQFRMHSLVGDGHPRMREEDFDALTASRDWLFRRVWPGTLPELEEAFENFRWICSDLQAVLSQHRQEVSAKHGVVAVAKFYNEHRYWNAEGGTDHALLDKWFDFYVFLVEDLTYELTRAANLICDLVRKNLDARYRVDEGVVTIESGPYMDFQMKIHRPHYAEGSGPTPYRGLQEFLTDRADRDEYRDEGGPPEGVRLPGESPFAD
ncbi:MAG TPA: hypothetical protein VGV69_06750 [Solirubrobacterales bacterium]|nr:hypothetical protein [Solirubrobacterales bacterium]